MPSPFEMVFKLDETKGESLPKHFELLVENLIQERTKLMESKIHLEKHPLQSDLLCCALVVLAIEEGFRLDDSYPTSGFDIRALRALKFMPQFRKDVGYQVNFVLPQAENWVTTVLAVPIIDDTTLIDFISSKKEILMYSKSLALKNSRYVAVFEKTKFGDIVSFCQDVRPVLREIRQMIFHGMQQLSVEILELPVELKRHLFKYLSAKDFMALTSTHSIFSPFRNDEDLWKYFLKRDFKMSWKTEDGSPKSVYIGKVARQRVSNQTFIPFLGQSLHRETSYSSHDNLPYPEQYGNAYFMDP